MPRIGIPELILILVLALIIFGPSRVSNLGGELGKGIRAFQEGLKGDKNQDKDNDISNNDSA
jgi:sec-independent protein translocase protein TatA